MTTPTSTSPTRVMSTYTKWLGWILVAVCLAAAVYLPVFDKANSEWLGSVMLVVVGAALVAAGMFAFGRTAAWLAMALVTVGALLGGVFLIWILLPLIAGIVLIVLFARDSFRSQPA